MDQPLPIFTVTIACSRQWGNVQQNSLDNLLVWSARLKPELGLHVVDTIKAKLNEILPGAMQPISISSAVALEALGKDKQLPLLDATPAAPACPIPETK